MVTPKKGSLSRIRNLGIMAHIDAGKTTVTERLLFITGKIHRMGEVHEGQATMDWMPQEQERGITITSAVTSFPWKNCELHLIDTPGHVDFTIEVERSLRVLDGVVTILDGVAGVEPQTETVWRQADKFRVPRFVFVNKLDRMGASFSRCVTSLVSHFGRDFKIVPVQLPVGEESDLSGVLDLVEMKMLSWTADDPVNTTVAEIPAHRLQAATEARNAMIEHLADLDDGIAERYLEGEDIGAEDIRRVLRQGTIDMKLVPVLCGSALKNRGLPPVLDGIVDYLPSPSDIGEFQGIDPATGETVWRPIGVNEPLCALSFKVQVMEDGRRMSYVRIYSGKLKVGEAVYNPGRKVDEKISRIFVMHANQKERVESVDAGHIVGVLGLKLTMTGDTLTERKNPILLESIEGKETVIVQAIEPMTTADKDKLDQALERLTDEDPTFRSFDDPDTGQRLISGMGELHLEVICDRIKRQFGVETRVGKPQVVLKETITAMAEADAVFDREHEDKRIFGAVQVRVEPTPRGQGIEFECRFQHPLLSRELLAAIEDGARESAKSGPVEGNMMDDVKVTLLQAEFIEGVMVPIAYRIAAAEATRKACLAASPVQMEPVMDVEVTVPEDFLGQAIQSINERRGKVEQMFDHAQFRTVQAKVPLRSMFGYSKDIRTKTQGRGTFTMTFSQYDILH
jgi:elongation factor G